MNLKDFNELSKRDFDNGAVLDAIRQVFKERDAIREAVEWFVECEKLLVWSSERLEFDHHSFALIFRRNQHLAAQDEAYNSFRSALDKLKEAIN